MENNPDHLLEFILEIQNLKESVPVAIQFVMFYL